MNSKRTTDFTRRRLLAAAAVFLAAPAAARAQEQPQPFNPLGDLLRDLFGGRPSWQRRDPFLPSEPEPEPSREPADAIVPEEWFLEPVNDGPFVFRRVNIEKIDPEFHRQLVRYPHNESSGTIVVDPRAHFLYSLREGGQAVRYGIGVGRQGFEWRGVATVGRKQEWPDWYPPKEMRLRQPELPEMMPGGPTNPLGARALYLFEGNRDTLYRIHGTAEPWSIGQSVSSGCIRMLNEEVMDLYLRTPVGTRVMVL